ncbi:hypothetical protein BDV33DRAFT_210444 [Aspergillus novoparasiticus]|uniref:Uncharacterized protein n=1 Tax=Aspergillus novoparasiticus TaxID=986946 RepID=A0A5N6E6J3_9EURO|nr:hypothetical protein BDV33DRAFT_210444 [Aspergillus novoparasiticus]
MARTRSGKETKGKPPVAQAKVAKPKPKASNDTTSLQEKLQSEKTTLHAQLDEANEKIRGMKHTLDNMDIDNDEKTKLQEQYNSSIRSRSDLQTKISEIGKDLADLDREDQEMDINDPEALEPHESPSSAEQTENPPIQSVELGNLERHDSAVEMDVSDDDENDDVLVSLQSLSISADGLADGLADAWFRARGGAKAIVRLGPRRHPKYEIRSAKGYRTTDLQDVSDAESRISSIMTRDQTGRRRRLYGLDNIAGLDGVAIVGNGALTSSKRAPSTYVKIKWVDIREEHADLCRNGRNWAPRSDLIAIIGKELADEKIKQMWNVQEERYANWKESQGERGYSARSPTPFPLSVYQETRKIRASMPPENYRNPTVKSEDENSSMAGPSYTGTTPITVEGQVSSDPSPMPSSPEGRGGSSASQARERDNSADINTDERVPKPKTFSEGQYMENMKRDLGLETLREIDMESYIHQMALVRASFDVYRGKMESNGYVLVQ